MCAAASAAARRCGVASERLAPRGATVPPRRGTSASATAGAQAHQQQQQQQGQVPPGFDLSLGIALAAAAFEAYLEPQGTSQGYQEVTLNHTHVTYTDAGFLKAQFEGLLQLTIHRAQGLKPVNITGGSDPYVIATLGDSSATTKVVWGDLNPNWGERHTLYVADRAKAVLRLRVMDKNKLMSDVDLGVAMLGLGALLNTPGQEVELPLKGTNAQGSLTVSAQFLPFTDDRLAHEAVVEGMQVPECPPEVSKLSSQLEVAMAVQEEVASKVQQVASEVQERVGLKGPSSKGTEAAAAASSSGAAGAAGEPEHLGDVVEGAKNVAVQTLTAAMDTLQGSLQQSGLKQQAEAVAKGKKGVQDKVNEAAAAVATFVESEGLGDLPATDLGAVIARIAASRASRGGTPASQGQAEAAATAAVAVAAAAAAAGSDEGGAASKLPAIAQAAMPQAWKALASVAGKMVEEVFQPVAFVENKETDTQVWVSVSQELREVVVAFRGTEQVKWKDLVSDLNLIPTSMDVERTGVIDLGLGSLPLPFAKFKKGKEIMVHSGFLAAYDSVRAKTLRIVDQLTADRSAEAPWAVFLTGHSLGGALATLAAYDLAGRRGDAAVGIKPCMYTFGAPRVGNKAFAEEFNTRLQGRSWRITNTSDIVPSVPRLMGYAHVANGVRLDSSGRLLFEPSSKDVLGEGREVAEVITDLAAQALEVAQGTRALEDVVDAIREHEMDILNALVDGSALGQHMEDFYLATLKEAVLAANPALAGKVQQALEEAAAAAPPTPPAAPTPSAPSTP